MVARSHAMLWQQLATESMYPGSRCLASGLAGAWALHASTTPLLVGGRVNIKEKLRCGPPVPVSELCVATVKSFLFCPVSTVSAMVDLIK